MARQPNTEGPIETITQIRGVNNLLWMEILKIALTRDPRTTRGIIKLIKKNDREVTKWLGKL